ncbi:MAG: hypothetical protein U0169_03965 [Polyangiaceae bacterium]
MHVRRARFRRILRMTSRSRTKRPLVADLAHRAHVARVLAAGLALAMTHACLAETTAHAAPATVDVHGTTRVEMHVEREGTRLVTHGTVVDDGGDIVPRANITMALALLDGATERRFAATGAVSCTADGEKPVTVSNGNVIVETDRAGRFCVRFALPVDRYAIDVDVGATTFLDASHERFVVELAAKSVTLRFEPSMRSILRDRNPYPFVVLATKNDGGRTVAAAGLPLVLSDAQGRTLASRTSETDGRSTFEVPLEKLAVPGLLEVRAVFAGNRDLAARTQALSVEARARVNLEITGSPDAALVRGTDGTATVDVRARWPFGAVDRGTVEARVGDVVVGAAPVRAGSAKLVVQLPDTSSASVPLRVRYAPDSPWFEPGAELTLAVPEVPPNPWRHVPLVLCGLALLAWFFQSRTAGRVRLPARARAGARAPAAVPSVEVVRRAVDARDGWSGHVADAHEGVGIDGARVRIERPGFGGSVCLAETTTATSGAFSLAPVQTRSGDVLRVEAPFHETLAKPVPERGELDVALIARRRAVLERLVAWAKMQGSPFDARPEPTPRHVANASRADDRTIAWAQAVEIAAFGGTALDAHGEDAIDKLAPSGPRGDRDPRDLRGADPKAMEGTRVKANPRHG